MRNLIQKKAKLNNAGMTLVEIIVAMGILSVAVIPLLFAFVNATRYNARGREVQQTTVLAHTVIENCKAYSLEEIDLQMTNTHDFLENTVGGWDKVSSTDVSTGISTTSYYMTNVQVENQRYDVELKLTPRKVGGVGTSSTDVQFEIMSTNTMNPYLDAVFTVQDDILSSAGVDASGNNYQGAATLDEQAYVYVLNEISAGIKTVAQGISTITEEVNLSAEEIENTIGSYGLKLYRTITINASDASGSDVVTVTYEYRYELTTGHFSYNYIYPDGSGTEVLTWNLSGIVPAGEAVTYTIYDNATTKVNSTKLENIYFFYYPAYNGSSSLCDVAADNVLITNNLTSGNPINVYLVKQKNLAYEETKLGTAEASYAPAVMGSGGTINLYHNFGDNLGGGASVGTPTFTGVTLPDVTIQPDPMILNTPSELIYTVEVSVYKENSYDATSKKIKDGINPVITMDGTALDW